MAGAIIVSLMIVLFVSLGIYFSMGKGAFLIAGYNMMSDEEKAEYDVVALCKFMGKMMFALSFAMLFWLLADVLGQDYLLYIGIALFFGITIVSIIYLNLGNRFKRKESEEKSE